MAENRSKPDQFLLRLPHGLRERVRERAESAGRSLNEEIVRAIEGSFESHPWLPEDLRHRIEQAAIRDGSTIEQLMVKSLLYSYPAPSDVMHVHLDNIRHALDLYERETDPRERLRLQMLVETMASAGHNFEIDWEEEYPEDRE